MILLFDTVLRLSIAGGLTCLVFWGLDTLLRNRLPKSWLYCLWLVAALRFIVPVSFSLPLNLPQLEIFQKHVSAETVSGFEPEPSVSYLYAPGTEQERGAQHTKENQTVSEQAAPSTVEFNTARLMSAVWLTGAGGMFLWYAFGYGLTMRRLKRESVLIKTGKTPVYESPLISTPILAGILRPAIYLPKNFEGSALAIRHELCHLRRGDIWAKWLVQLVVCIHWFNPLIYLLKREINRLSELACDEAVVRHLDDAARRAYGYMLLETLRSSSGIGGLMIAASGTNKRWLKERMHGIMNKHTVTKKAFIAMVFMVIIMTCTAILAGCALSSNYQVPDSATASATPSDKSIVKATPIEPANNIAIKTASKSDPSDRSDSFVTDPDVLGTWDKVAAVKMIDDFDPSQISAPDPNPMNLVFSENGAMNFPVWSWTKSLVLFNHVGRSCSYELKEIDGTKYLFLNYVSDEPSMNYSVFKWSSASTTPVRLVDDIDLPFVEDPAAIGTWKSVDYVRNISDFDPAAPTWTGDLYLKEMTFVENGGIMIPGVGFDNKTLPYMSWTNGAIMHQNDQIACHYEIKEINGTTYMFFEWKSGDYVFLHMKPDYFVLEKAN